MKRFDLEKYIGKTVCVSTVFHDSELLCGELHKSGDPAFKNDLNLYLTRNYYFVTLPGTLKCISYLFRSSHVRKVKEIHNSRHYYRDDIKLEE